MRFRKNARKNREIIRKLEKLQPTPPRQQQAVDSGRSAFLKKAESLGSPVSISLHERLNMWLQKQQIRVLVYRTLTTLMITLFFIFLGGGVTAYAAQDALPGDRMYGMKVWVEDARIWLTVSPERDLELHLEIIRDRLDEMRLLLDRDQIEGLDRVISNFFGHLEDAKCLLGAVQNQTHYNLIIEGFEQEYYDLFASQEFEAEAEFDIDDGELEDENEDGFDDDDDDANDDNDDDANDDDDDDDDANDDDDDDDANDDNDEANDENDDDD